MVPDHNQFLIQGQSEFEKSVNLGAKTWPSNKIYWLPNHQNILTKHICDENEACNYKTTESANLKIHKETCNVETTVTGLQQPYGKPIDMIDELIRNDILSEEMRDFSIDQFCVYDIEVVQSDIDGETRLIPISIAVSSTFTEDHYFERKTMQPEDGDKMISSFMDYLTEIYEIYKAQ